MRIQNLKKISALFILIGLWACGPAHAQNTGLIDLLSGQLGITKDQASGGAGSIFQLAKQNLSANDFSSVAKAVPEIDQMMDSAPKTETGSGTLGRISSMFGGSTKLDGLAGLTSSFEKLGLDSGMVNAFIPIMLNYVKGSGGENVMNLLKGALL